MRAGRTPCQADEMDRDRVSGMTIQDQARALAEPKLAHALPQRWRHVQAVGRKAEKLSGLPGVSGDLLIAAAWLHDIGYAPDLIKTGFHPLDGARFLRNADWNDRLVPLVAHHSCAVHEAYVRGLDHELLVEFKQERSATYDALVYCDLTTSPYGQTITYIERMAEIQRRYGSGHEVTRAVDLARVDLAACCQRTLSRMSTCAS